MQIYIESRDRYQIMWLAGIRHVALGQHCLRSFGQPDRPRVNPARRNQLLELPTQNPPLAWYLCALPQPWDWSKNAHLAFEAAPGEQWDGPALVPGLFVRLNNARPIIGWGEHSIPPEEPLRRSIRYRTCRNWQFAWWLRIHRNAPDAPLESEVPKRKGEGEQMSLI
ncbi:hypothetical protein AB0I84_11070 [Streptomyces spectabilis]|uniref:hypothetical protein n=1 Tax=Streptomyces spectabilis TaxID=68270 RepID=UPI0033C27BB0